MGPSSYMRSVVDRNVVMGRVPEYIPLCLKSATSPYLTKMTCSPHCLTQHVIHKQENNTGEEGNLMKGRRGLSKEKRNLKEK